MRNDVNTIETRYRGFFSIAIPFIVVLFVINVVYEIVHNEGRDILKNSLIVIGILIFALFLRLIGLKIIESQR